MATVVGDTILLREVREMRAKDGLEVSPIHFLRGTELLMRGQEFLFFLLNGKGWGTFPTTTSPGTLFLDILLVVLFMQFREAYPG